MIRGKEITLIVRYGDINNRFADGWMRYANWINEISSATREISANYKDVVYAVAPFNEPDNQMGINPSQFMNDPAIQGTTWDSRVNWLWI